MKPGPEADLVLLEHMLDRPKRINEYTDHEEARFDGYHLVQDAVTRNLQVLAESSQRLSTDIKATEAQIPWRELSGFRNVIVHDYLGIDLDAVRLVVVQDLPPLSEALSRMLLRLSPSA